ncbi:LacI family transcriptional regulator [Labrys miyagiensis]|uniref:LacI family transcriptional regulator n=1 Tax=Labrys miyagiensis TaxID=346912 RepID=A0ABQ6CYQ4_9HYPH|nr:LacI family DNA-binding transcriptional regulator [Labrys miyagiensis]GLS23361.1 LacI family transcriptional regulator [Labrys miyagiensis]
MDRPKVTSHDVAERAGVSRATVSMVLNRSPGVSISQETRERVLLAAAALGYRPNSAARMLVRGDTETIGLVVTEPASLHVDGFVPQLLTGITRVNQRHGYGVLLEVVEPNRAPNAYVDLVRSHRIDGLIVLNPATHDPALHALIDDAYPLVILGSVGHPGEHSVNFSTRRAIRKAVDHLVDLGHRRIAHIGFSDVGYIATDVRLAAYQRSLADRGITPDPALVGFAHYSAESGHAAMAALLERADPAPTAVLAGNDTVALGVIAAINARGLAVPGDIAVIGFDDLPIAAYMRPSLTTIRNPGIEQGEKAAEMLIKMINREPVERPKLVVATELVIRESSGGART